jgi:transcription factor E2F3
MGEKQTLVALTQSFLKILTDANGSEVELTSVEAALKTTKRRLYDVINVLSGVGLVERTGKSRVRLLSTFLVEPKVTTAHHERERELDELIRRVDHELLDMSNSELFKECAWIDRADADRCEPDYSVSLYSIRGPPSMSIIIKDTDPDSNDRIISCQVENPHDGHIQCHPVRALV